ncbi:MAG: response regulator transcription factor [Clostridia bacterium]|nr:response regulator transcription factor [Clostridia bacterium]
MRIALCDDEQAENERLKNRIYSYAAARDLDAVCDCFVSAAALLEREKYDLYFLDYAMPEMNGVELAVRLREKFSGALTVCFLTSYERAAVEVINRNVGAEAFLVKPVAQEQLNGVLDRLFRRSLFHRIVLKKEKSVCVVYPQEILYVEVRNKECLFRFYDRTEAFPYPLNELRDAYLPKELFFQVHRSYLVNLMHVAAFDKSCVTMTDGNTVPLRKYKAFAEAFSAFNFQSF